MSAAIFKVLRRLYAPLLVLFFWFLFSSLLGEELIPSPLDVGVLLLRLMLHPHLWFHLGFSLFRISSGILLALMIGVPTGLAAGIRPRVDRLVAPLLYLLYPLPKIAFLPLFMVLFGLGDLSKIILIWTVIVFQIIIASRDGVKDIPASQINALRTLGLSRRQFLVKLYLPSSLPRILTAVRVSLGISISVLFFAENFATTWGIGYFVMNSWIMVDYTRMFAGIAVISLLGLSLFRLLDWLERRICPWMYL